MPKQNAVDTYDDLTSELHRLEALLDLVIEHMSNAAEDYGRQVALECARAQLAIVDQHAKKLLAFVSRVYQSRRSRARI